MNILAIIPARGGSKGIPRKNILSISGKPLIAHTIECALNTSIIDRVVVSTDDPEIAAVSKQYGAEVVLRPIEISGDLASSEAALLHTLDYLKKNEGSDPEILVFLQCTSPLTLPEDVEGTIRALVDEDADSALAVAPFHYFLWRQDSDRNAVSINHDKNFRPMRQEREPQYIETGAVYAMRTEGFFKAKHRFFGKTAIYVMPAERRLEIDEPVDFEIAEVIIRKQHVQKMIELLPDPIAAVAFDFDGVFTDNKVLVFQDGQEAVFCDRGDGMGLEQLKNLNIPLLVVSKEENPVVVARCRKLEIPCRHNISDKLSVLKSWLQENNLDPLQVIYVGNDINDLECLQEVGCGVAVGDSHPMAKASAKIVLSSNGGEGAIRELTDLIIERIRR